MIILGALFWTTTGAGAPPLAPSGGTGAGGGRRYRFFGYSPEPARRKVEKKIEAIDAKIEAKRNQIDLSINIAGNERLLAQLRELESQLNAAIAQLATLEEAQEEREVLEAYAAYRSKFN